MGLASTVAKRLRAPRVRVHGRLVRFLYAYNASVRSGPKKERPAYQLAAHESKEGSPNREGCL